MFDGGGQSAEPCRRCCCPNASVKRTQDDSLESSAGKSSNSDSGAVDVRIVVEIVDASPHRKIKQTQPVIAGQVQQADIAMFASRCAEFAKVYKLRTECNDPAT